MMFTILSKAVDFLIDLSRKPPESIAEVSQHNLEDSPFLVNDEPSISRSVQGAVTHIFHGHGLIENEIYFSLSDVNGNEPLQVGDKVDATIVQHNEHGGWYAERISIMEKCWKEEEVKDKVEIDLEELQRSSVVGKVTEFASNRGRINADIVFCVADCADGFIPARGDWISASIDESEAVQDDDPWGQGPVTIQRARNVCPARTQEIEGRITAVMKDYGFINEEIYFQLSSCLNGYRPRKADTVKAVMIESSQRKDNWRVITVYPMSSTSGAYRSQQFQKPAEKSTSAFLVPGQRPKFSQRRLILPVKLPHFTVPEYLEACVMEGRELTEVAPLLVRPLDASIYSRRMSILLHLEEIQMQMDIRQFDLVRVCLHPAGEFLSLTVPGLAEGRPSVLVGDKIILYSPCDPDGPSYEGFVHELTCTDVHLKFNPDFHNRYRGEDYNVEFTFSRGPLRKCHQAVCLAVQYLGVGVLFPKKVELKSPQVNLADIMPSEENIYESSDVYSNSHSSHTNHPNHNKNNNQRSSHPKDRRNSGSSHGNCERNMNQRSTHPHHQEFSSQDVRSKTLPRMPCKRSLEFYNRKLNQRQKDAVRNILIGQARPIPYVIFGPPGTGKTITVVEAILQVLKKIPSSRIVACTPSNSAADLIAERLHQSGHVRQTDMVRLNAFQRSCDSLPESILQYCKFADDLELISHYRVIVSTCTMAGSLYGLGLSAGHLTHVFVDECGQATEPECLIPMGLISGGDGQIVLAGDPKQLGPIVASPFSKMYGLELSLLERLMTLPLYQRDEEMFADSAGFNPSLVTMLVNNYRSHPSILSLPSRLFYFNQLVAHADPSLTHTLTSWPMLPTHDFPIVFHGIRGEDIREANSPSWFNPAETVQVVRYLQGALKAGMEPEDIGIITPYRKQVEKIRMMIERLNMPDIKVGSVEEFQGQERQVIIISTVRSNEKLVGFDVRHTLGFVSSPKRFNVAITRAQALLVMVGNPHVLSQDTNWQTLIKYCSDNGGYTGCELPDFSNITSQTETEESSS